MPTRSANNGNQEFFKNQSTKNQLLAEFKRYSSSELSFLRMAATLSLPDALCHLIGRSARSLFRETVLNFHKIIKQHRHDPLVVAFMLNNNINPNKGELSHADDDEIISFCLMELTKHLA